MKRFIIFLYLVVAVISASAQTKTIEGFWGLTFGMDKAVVDGIVREKNSDKGMSVISGKTQIIVNKVTMDNERYKYALLDFYRGKLLAGYFVQKAKTNEDATIAFLRIRENLTSKYGNPEVETEDVITCYWNDNKRNIVQLSMSKEGSSYNIGLLYLNGLLNSHKILDEQMGLK